VCEGKKLDETKIIKYIQQALSTFFRMKHLKNISEIIVGYTFREALQWTDRGNTKVLLAKNITEEGNVNYDELLKIDMNLSNTSAYVQSGDIILTSRGVFRAAVYEGNEKKTIAASSVYILRPKNELIVPQYLSIYLNSKRGQSSIQKVTSGGTIKTIPRKNLEELSIPLPDLKTQQQIINIDRNWRKRAKLLEQKINLSKNVAEGAIQYLLTV
jgi:restriction endonuclease S subunit